jgi:hypothetical protein
MKIYDKIGLASTLSQGGFQFKAVLNDAGMILFPVTREHRDTTAEGLSYKDDYKGNALAAMLMPGKIEIRYHARFSDVRVTKLLERLLSEEALEALRGWEVTYQGRVLIARVKPEPPLDGA